MGKDSSEVLIIGGGLAGLLSALILQAKDRDVILLEARDYPRHKVCGEFISREVVPLFDQLDLWPKDYELPQIKNLKLTVASGKSLSLPLSHGAIGWSRFQMDKHLADTFTKRGGTLLTNSAVKDLKSTDDGFILQFGPNQKLKGKLVFAAMGKRSPIDKLLGIQPSQRSHWMGWKMHFNNKEFPSDQVHLHNFPGGYAGLSRVEEGRVNMATLLDSRLIKREGNSWLEVRKVLAQNKHLDEFLRSSKELIKRPIAVSQLDYSPRPQVAKGVLLLGDAAGMIHPLSGNGMAMAIGSAQIAVKSALPFLDGKIDRKSMEASYSDSWQNQYKQRLRISRLLRAVFAASGKSEMALRLALAAPPLAHWLEKQTHGKAPAL